MDTEKATRHCSLTHHTAAQHLHIFISFAVSTANRGAIERHTHIHNTLNTYRHTFTFNTHTHSLNMDHHMFLPMSISATKQTQSHTHTHRKKTHLLCAIAAQWGNETETNKKIEFYATETKISADIISDANQPCQLSDCTSEPANQALCRRMNNQ